jgi:hypothetical protein
LRSYEINKVPLLEWGLAMDNNMPNKNPVTQIRIVKGG